MGHVSAFVQGYLKTQFDELIYIIFMGACIRKWIELQVTILYARH